jgi:zinc D-Ala-D-Ala carboxypeptidase
MNLSTHFTLEELTASQTAVRRGICNLPPVAVIKNLARLAGLLEQVRELAGKPIAISSGYRSPELNRWVGGSSTSAHTLGLAADITCSGITPKALAMLIRESAIGYDQLIYEGTWVHIGLSEGDLRGQVLTANFKGGSATYTKGIQ